MGVRSEYIAELEAKLANYDEMVRILRVMESSGDSKTANAAHIVLGVVDG